MVKNSQIDGPRLRPRISHIGIWVAVACVIISIAELSLPVGLSTDLKTTSRIFAAIQGLAYGAAITCCLILYRLQRIGDVGAYQHPGHWVALVMACSYVLTTTIAIGTISLVRMGMSDGPMLRFLMVFAAVAFLILLVGIEIAATRRFWSDNYWKVFFVANIILLLVATAVSSLDDSQRFPDLVTLICIGTLLVAMLHDKFDNSQRDWIHFAGATAYLLFGLQRVVWNFFASEITWLMFAPK